MSLNPYYHLFVVEDSDEDFEIWLWILRQAGIENAVHRATEGREAFAQLKQSAARGLRTRPALIVLDLNMPGIDGRKLLQQIKEDPDLQMIPVVVWSTSIQPDDIDFCYRHGVNGYLRKSEDIAQLKRDMEIFVAYWLELVLLPHPKLAPDPGFEQLTYNG